VALIRADPKPGCLPETPLLPSNDISQDGFFRFPVIIVGDARGGRRAPRTYVDPPVAVGYRYLSEGPRFASVRVPAPLPGGDQEFEVRFNGRTEPLAASSTFRFTDFISGGAAEFEIVGIDETEGLRDDDPRAFVTGVDFVQSDMTAFDVIMTPIRSEEPPAVVHVVIDIKPKSSTNVINLGSNDSVPVAILSSSDFDARQVDPLSVSLAGSSVRLKGTGTPMSYPEDVNGDGLPDLIVHINTQTFQLTDEDTEAVLRGTTIDGTPIEGRDSIRIVR
jgi:hypothetical protein